MKKKIVALLSAFILAVSPTSLPAAGIYASDDATEVTDGDALIADDGQADIQVQTGTDAGADTGTSEIGASRPADMHPDEGTTTIHSDNDNLYADDDGETASVPSEITGHETTDIESTGGEEASAEQNVLTDDTSDATHTDQMHWTITFDANGGTASSDISDTKWTDQQEKGESFGYWYEPYRSGYAFVGWSEDQNATEPQYQPDISEVVFEKDMTLYAIWKEAWMIFYDANGGTRFQGSEETQWTEQIVKGERLSAYETAFREGMIFAGWSEDQNATEPHYTEDNISSLPSDEDVTLYAIWKEAWTITFDANGGTASSDISDTKWTDQQEKGESFGYWYEPYWSGYAFVGWSEDQNATEPQYQPDISEVVFEKDMTLYAIWKEAWTIFYDANGGTRFQGSEETQWTEQIVKGESLSAYETAFREGMFFAGWSEDQNATEPHYTEDNISSLPSDEDVTLYAIWKEAWTITFDANGGTASSDISDTKWTDQQEKGESFGYWYEPYRSGYAFVGWSEDPNATEPQYQPDISEVVFEKDRTLYAVWKDSWTVTFHANGGTRSQDGGETEWTEQVARGESLNYTETAYRKGLALAGWSEDKNANRPQYTEESISSLIPERNMNFYAVWTTAEEKVVYQTHVQYIGWQNEVKDGATAGAPGRSMRLEAVKIRTEGGVSGSIAYQTHVQSDGWQNWVMDGAQAGTTGQNKRLEAIRIALTGDLDSEYDVYYRVHVQHFGWLDWASNGAPAGTSGFGYRMEAVQIRLVRRGSQAPGRTATPFLALSLPNVSYQTHVQKIGWQRYVSNGLLSGTTGKALRLEGIRIRLGGGNISGGITYETHVQSFGWQKWVANGAMAGTAGKAKRLEAIRINLTGELANVADVYYRVHAQKFGWLGWTKNGAPAGTAGYAYRLEGIQIRIVQKGQEAPSGGGTAFRQKKVRRARR